MHLVLTAAGLVVALLVALGTVWAKRAVGGAAGLLPGPDSIELPQDLVSEVAALCAQGQRIAAIRRVRQQTGWNLSQAKAAVQAIAAGER